MLRLDFGESLFIGKPVTEALLDRVQPTGLLALYSLTLSVVIAIPAGVLAAVRANSLLDRLLMVLSISGAAIPSFFFGILLILLFAVVLGWLPSGGYVDIGDDPVAALQVHDPADARAGLLGGRAAGAAGALDDARRAQRGLRAHRLRQGAAASGTSCCGTPSATR